MQKRAAFYLRVSTIDKQDHGYQLVSLEDYSKMKVADGFVDVYEEKVSGYKHGDERPELKKLLDAIKEDNIKYDCIYITEISRIGRRAKHVREVLEILESCKVNLKIKSLGFDLLDDNKKPNSNGKLMLNIFIEMADMEAIIFKERSKAGIKAGIKAGNAGGGAFLPYGFKKVGKKLVVDEIEASVVIDIFNLYLEGYGVKKIANILNGKHTRTRTNISFNEKEINKKTGRLGKEVKWVDKTVDDILLNPIYIGKRRYWGGKESKRNNSEPELIDLEGEPILNPISIYNDCLEIRKTKTHRNYLTKYTYLLKDKVKCAICGRNYFARFKPNEGGDKVYICSSRLVKGNSCDNLGVNISLLESSIFNEIVSSDSLLKYISDNNDIKKRLESELTNLKFTLTNSENEIIFLDDGIKSSVKLQRDSERKSNKALVSYHQEIIDGDLKKLENLKASIPLIERRLKLIKNALKNNSSIKTTAKELIKNKNDRTKLRTIFLEIIDKVYVRALNKDTVFVDVHIKLDDIVLPVTLKLFLDIKSLRKHSKSLRYIPFLNIGYELIYKNDRLDLDVSTLENYYSNIISNLGLLDDVDFHEIPENHILNVLDDRQL
jgi:site-specific DNA recombinase